LNKSRPSTFNQACEEHNSRLDLALKKGLHIMANYRAYAQYLTRETLSRAEPVIDDALSKLGGPIQSLTWNGLPYAAKRKLGTEVSKGLDVPYEAGLHLVKMVLERRQTRAIIAVFRGERTLIEAAAETKISPVVLGKELELRRPALERIFDPEGPALRRTSGAQAQKQDVAVGELDDAILSVWDQGSEQYKAIVDAAQRVGTTPSVFIGALEAFRSQTFDPRDPRTIARQTRLLLFQRGKQEQLSEAIPIGEPYGVIKHLAQLSATKSQKDIAEYAVPATGDSSQSAESSVKTASRGNRTTQ
jgi:hypothetical protein